jgi:hypothetical protein
MCNTCFCQMRMCIAPLYKALVYCVGVCWMLGGGGGERNSEQHLSNTNSDASSSCMCKSTPPQCPPNPTYGPGLVPTTGVRQVCLLAPQRETQSERDGACSTVCSVQIFLCRIISPCPWCYKGRERPISCVEWPSPTHTPLGSHHRTRSTLICHGNTLWHVDLTLISVTRLFWRCARFSPSCQYVLLQVTIKWELNWVIEN